MISTLPGELCRQLGIGTRTLSPACPLQVRAADRGQRHGPVPHGLLGKGRALRQADAPGQVPADAAAPGRRGEHPLGFMVWAGAGQTPGTHEICSLTLLYSWTEERKCNEGFVS